jgi:hypothetical protein
VKGACRFVAGRGIQVTSCVTTGNQKAEGHFTTVLSFGLHRLHAKGLVGDIQVEETSRYLWELYGCLLFNSAAHADSAVKADRRGRCTVYWCLWAVMLFGIWCVIDTCTHVDEGDLLRAGRSGDRISVWARFSAPFQTGTGTHTASYTVRTVFFKGLKRPGRGVDHPPSSSAEVTQRVELQLCSRSRPSWPVLGWTLP